MKYKLVVTKDNKEIPAYIESWYEECGNIWENHF